LGLHMPVALRSLMATFPQDAVRMMGERLMLKRLLEAYSLKSEQNVQFDEEKKKHKEFPQFYYELVSHKYGLPHLADWHATEMVLSCRHYHRKNRASFHKRMSNDSSGALLEWNQARIWLFGRFLGALEDDEFSATLPLIAHTFMTDSMDLFIKFDETIKSYESVTQDNDRQIDIDREKSILVSVGGRRE